MLVLRRCTISLVTLALVLAGMATVAQANDASVRATIKAQTRAINQSPQLKGLLKGTKIKLSQAPQLIKLCHALAGKLDHAAGVVAQTTASTAQGRLGKTNWVKGARGLAHGFSQLETALKDLEHGNKSAGQTEAASALKTIANANALGVKADHELKLSTGS